MIILSLYDIFRPENPTENGISLLHHKLETIRGEMRALHEAEAEDKLQVGTGICENSVRKDLEDFEKNEQLGR